MKNKNMLLRISAIIIMALMMIHTSGFAQEDSLGPDNRPAKPAFESGYLIDQQTANIPVKNTLEFAIHHRFGTLENGVEDLYGIYATSNIRLGLNYTFINNLLVGIGTTKFKKYQDMVIKYNILKQTRSLSIPVSVTFFENIGLDCRDKGAFGTEYKFSHRFSYFSQLIITHRINNMVSLQVAPSFTHFNIVGNTLGADSTFDHDKIGLSFGGRIKLTPQTSIIAAVDLPLEVKGISEFIDFPTNKSKPNISLGVEVSTSTHAFQMFIATAQGILPQENMMWNNLTGSDKLSISQFMIGFNITRLWNF
jgi:hypothetical protein